MNRFEQDLQRVRLEEERAQLEALRRAYAESLADVKAKVERLKRRKVTPGTAQSVERQINYAQVQALQLDKALNLLNGKVVGSVQEYLEASYKNGLYGTAYTLHGQGIPVSLGVNTRAMAEAVRVKTAGLKFSDRLYGENVEELKTRYLSTLARGIGNGWNYDRIAMELSLDTGISMRRAYVIARTEGARVYQASQLDAMREAKAKGADIVKEWNSTLDMKTRPAHGRLDGQIREVEEPFEIDGMRAMHPLGFGVAAMDICCRCVMNQRARWALEAEKNGEFQRTKWDGERGEIAEYQPYTQWLEEYEADHGAKSPVSAGLKKSVDAAIKGARSVGAIHAKMLESLGGIADKMGSEVILTNERLNHIAERHPGDYEKYGQHIEDMLDDPDYIVEDDRHSDTAIILKTYDGETLRITLKLTPEQQGRMNSILTFQRIREKELKRLLRNKRIIYKIEKT